MTAITLTHLYALLSEKVGKEEAEALTSYVEQKVDKTIEEKTTHLATKADVIKIEERTQNGATKADIADLRTELADLEVRMGTKMDTHFRWTIGTFISMMLGIIYFVLNYVKH